MRRSDFFLLSLAFLASHSLSAGNLGPSQYWSDQSAGHARTQIFEAETRGDAYVVLLLNLERREGSLSSSEIIADDSHEALAPMPEAINFYQALSQHLPPPSIVPLIVANHRNVSGWELGEGNSAAIPRVILRQGRERMASFGAEELGEAGLPKILGLLTQHYSPHQKALLQKAEALKKYLAHSKTLTTPVEKPRAWSSAAHEWAVEQMQAHRVLEQNWAVFVSLKDSEKAISTPFSTLTLDNLADKCVVCSQVFGKIVLPAFKESRFNNLYAVNRKNSWVQREWSFDASDRRPHLLLMRGNQKLSDLTFPHPALQNAAQLKHFLERIL